MQERWLQIHDTKKSFMEGFVAFGGGRYQCPGRLVKHDVLTFVQVFMRNNTNSSNVNASDEFDERSIYVFLDGLQSWRCNCLFPYSY